MNRLASIKALLSDCVSSDLCKIVIDYSGEFKGVRVNMMFTKDSVNSVAAVGENVASVTWNGDWILWSPATDLKATAKGAQVKAVATTTNGMVVVAGTSYIKFFNFETNLTKKMIFGRLEITSLASAHCNMVVSGNETGRLQMWTSLLSEPMWSDHVPTCVTAVAVCLEFVLASCDKVVHLRSTVKHLTREFAGHQELVTCLAFLHESNFVSGSHDKTVRVWDIETGATLLVLNHVSWVTALAVFPNQTFASGSCDSYVRVFDLSGGCLLLKPSNKDVRALAVTASGKLIVASGDKTTLWE